MILLNTSRAACLALFSAAVIFISSSAAFAATITVTGTGDTIAVDGVVTLREAITSANNNANVNTDVVAVGVYGTDTINFNIPGAGIHTISPGSALPDITDPVTIDGYMQPGASANTLAVGDNAVLLIELNGTGAGAGASGLVITAGSSTVRGLVINRFNSGGGGESGITLQTGGGNTITGNFIGTDSAGTVAQPNLSGLDILSSPNNIIGGITVGARNLVSANINEQLLIDGSSASGNQVQGNYIGTNAAGSGSLMTAASNRGQGITLRAPSNTIGGTAAGAGNLISGNGNEGIFINIANSN
ncbi:MAG: trimeric autotransporter adhesin, partial [Verrucomicrobiota bacterium]